MKTGALFNPSLFAIAALAALSFVLAGTPTRAGQIVQGCDQARAEPDDIRFPAEAFGNVPDRIANWEIAFQRGKYRVRIASRFDFEPFIYRKINGEYKYAGLHRNASFQNDRNGNPFFYYDFTVDSDVGVDRDHWLLQVKPERSAQNINHVVRLLITGTCKKAPEGNTRLCPPGTVPDDGTTVFGQVTCVPKN